LRAALALAICALLPGCGFHPLYGGPQEVETQADAALAAIHVEPIPDRIGQLVANTLRDTFNPHGEAVEPRYTLAVSVTATHSDLAIRRDGTASRELFLAYAGFQLYTKAGGLLASGAARSNTSYDIGTNEYSVIVANEDAQTRAAQDIAQQISQQVSLVIHQQAAK
jgi:LPS-assembly lipoprotein